ncbi:MAG TPA: bifunctional [glutamate--ammonia ligase]-adenylyl-L-tyrosine phosphorylase/[glutamate--ammonia-ligase] adenylyltransferase [Geothermobacteraceae bacterium]|nr:bifunctional [glutamate--ammonia ligase]-adenylyl-L-tyrosine phosphorylase/[glutamate--ammonia-ligase] adenylyltransferase [Geothermobacteraceae bacterium]
MDSALADRIRQACQTKQSQQLTELAQETGFASGSKSATNLSLLFEAVGDQLPLTNIIPAALASADPDQALNNLERLCGTLAIDDLLAALERHADCNNLLTILGGSGFLSGILCRCPDFFHYLFQQRAIDQAVSEAEMVERLREKIPEPSGFEQLQAGLRQFKARQILRIGSRDLCGKASLQEVTAELAGLASASLQRAYEICDRLLRSEHGVPLLESPEGSCPLEAEFTILGMGKLGGRELNFSSDIDLIYFYTSEKGATSGHDPISDQPLKSISLHQYFCKLGELISKALNQVTADGFVFRVDLNLRPEGVRGELAHSLRSAEVYYESWGQSWERSAMLKARPVAGSISFGRQLLKTLEPFIYRRYLDYGMVEDMKVMKQKIDHSLAREREGSLNLKLGRGGIREIEFFIQALQLIFAGKDPELREKNSLKALDALLTAGHIKSDEHKILRDAYIFLRTTEHRIQVVQESQTHNLPTQDAPLNALARRCGFQSRIDFEAELERHRNGVAEIFHSLFYTSEEELQDVVRPEISFLFDKNADSDLVKDLLEEKGFKNPDAAYDSLQLLQNGPAHNPMSQQTRRQLEKLAPLLIQAVIDSPEPDMALTNLENFLVAMRARATFFALLTENHEIIQLLVTLFATSQFLSRIFIQNPAILDSLVSRSYAVAEKSKEQFREELALQLKRVDYYEDQLDVLRHFKKEEFLRIALNDIYGRTLQGSTASQLSALADCCLEKAFELARKELIPRFGIPTIADREGTQREAGFAILGMGKLGGQELNYHSDLDIIFIYEGEGANQPTAGTEPARFKEQSNQEYFARLAQRIISILTLVTREGSVYEIDTRLRPSGNQGPLVTSLKAFRRYHGESAQLWERQALTKARVVYGPAGLAEPISDLITEIVYNRPLAENTEKEILRLRGRMEKEVARETRQHFNIKVGRGGMVDVEFLAQYLQLKHGKGHPELRTQNTLEILHGLWQKDFLREAEYRQLSQGYKFLRRLENKLRLVHDQSINDLSGERSYLVKLAQRLGYPPGPVKPEVALLDDYHRKTEQIRCIFNKYLGDDLEMDA